MAKSLSRSILKTYKYEKCKNDFVIFYSFFIVVFTTGLSFFEHGMSRTFRRELWAISVYSNLLVNLLYAVAVIWIPRKKNFTSLF